MTVEASPSPAAKIKGHFSRSLSSSSSAAQTVATVSATSSEGGIFIVKQRRQTYSLSTVMFVLCLISKISTCNSPAFLPVGDGWLGLTLATFAESLTELPGRADRWKWALRRGRQEQKVKPKRPNRACEDANARRDDDFLSPRERSQHGQQQRAPSAQFATESRKRGRDLDDKESWYAVRD